MSFLTNIEQLRQVEWGRQYLWDIKFPTAPEPFGKWFPASDYEEILFDVETHSFKAHTRTLEIPKSRGVSGIQVTFFDDVGLTLNAWFADWVNAGVFLGGMGVATIGEASRELVIQRLDLKREPLHEWTHWVIPKGAYSAVGTSESAPLHPSLSFIVLSTTKNF